MTVTRPVLKHIAIITHPRLKEAVPLAEKITHQLNELGIQTSFGFLYNEDIHRQAKAGAFNLLIALGGDGTMLRAGHLTGPCNLPILGINLGHFGFLMEMRVEQWDEFFPRLVAGDYWLEKRMMLCAEQWRGGDKLGSWEVLNEVVVSRGQSVRPIHLTARVDGHLLTTYVADGLIASTPTGSTAYALAAGGPILPPELRNILLTPVAPHLSVDRSIVLAESASVSISIKTDHQAVFSVDGQVPIGLTEDDRIEVHAGSHNVLFVRFLDAGYFYRNLTQHMNHNPASGGSS